MVFQKTISPKKFSGDAPKKLDLNFENGFSKLAKKLLPKVSHNSVSDLAYFTFCYRNLTI